MTNKAAGNKAGLGDFSTLFREIQAGRKPIDALFDDLTFRKNLRAIVVAAWKLKPEPEDLAAEIFHDALISLQRFESHYLHNLESEFDDLLANMQTTKSKRAVKKAFEASPTQLGRAAVKQASKKR